MNLEKLLELVFNNPDNISIEYSNINGKERLFVNGEDLSSQETFDDSEIVALINKYKENIELVDDCVFMEMIDEVSEIVNLKELDKFLNQKHFTKEEAELVEGWINFMNTTLCEKIQNKIQNLVELLGRF